MRNPGASVHVESEQKNGPDLARRGGRPMRRGCARAACVRCEGGARRGRGATAAGVSHAPRGGLWRGEGPGVGEDPQFIPLGKRHPVRGGAGRGGGRGRRWCWRDTARQAARTAACRSKRVLRRRAEYLPSKRQVLPPMPPVWAPAAAAQKPRRKQRASRACDG